MESRVFIYLTYFSGGVGFLFLYPNLIGQEKTYGCNIGQVWVGFLYTWPIFFVGLASFFCTGPNIIDQEKTYGCNFGQVWVETRIFLMHIVYDQDMQLAPYAQDGQALHFRPQMSHWGKPILYDCTN